MTEPATQTILTYEVLKSFLRHWTGAEPTKADLIALSGAIWESLAGERDPPDADDVITFFGEGELRALIRRLEEAGFLIVPPSLVREARSGGLRV